MQIGANYWKVVTHSIPNRKVYISLMLLEKVVGGKPDGRLRGGGPGG